MEVTKKMLYCPPIGKEQTDIRRAAEGIIDAVIEPSLENLPLPSLCSVPRMLTLKMEGDLAA
ncbi:hypothetical protein [Terribacillus saccharophilus]|uniref:Uncharacterized protein n=2 Tax=Terribacillus saccharophilus TaxID=361277 RepID=A0ABX4H3L4_9BACI|nr:hypothetical protein [Terribacillus saccharophilus]PAD37090.1 hypothetical protein CHH56_01680 [Terribacillus saccharophilus]PAD97567.1 hypothetical protein CHH50_02385 [Terribacillus saccharophilus]PAE01614.1 hypothetical protein CHH48_02380 [Terribacillus saccharophilus]